MTDVCQYTSNAPLIICKLLHHAFCSLRPFHVSLDEGFSSA